jgi:beta-lactamase class D
MSELGVFLVIEGRRRVVLIVGGVAAVAVIVAGFLVLWPSDKPTADPGAVPTIANTPSTGKVVDAFLKLVTSGDAASASSMTDDPPTAQADLATFGKNIAPTVVAFIRTTTSEPAAGATTAKATVGVNWKLDSGAWTYQTSLDLVLKDGKWLMKWAPSMLYATLVPGQNLALLGKVGESGQPAVLGDDGKPLMTWDGASAKAADPKISPLILQTMVRGTSGPGVADTRHVSVVDAAGKVVGPSVHGTDSAPASTEPVKSTLNASVSIAAQNAVESAKQPTMLVAIKPSTGGILAVAQNSAAGTALTALHGQYQPGSTFKIATAAAGIQQAGLSPESDVQCPGSGTFSGRTIHNAGFELGPTKLRTAFARSCNTTFADIASQLPTDALKKAATQFGLNADFDIPGVTTELGKVEASDSPARQVENAIGQGTVTVSPLGMALVVATVAARHAVTPQLLKDEHTTVTTGYTAPPAAVLDQLRSMMIDVVKVGTASKLKGITGLAGKTGTAETTNNGTEAHGWFVGIRGDVAFAVLVQDGGSSSVALDVAGQFLKGF